MDWNKIETVAAWLATGVCVIFAIHVTKSAAPLWAFFIPAIWK